MSAKINTELIREVFKSMKYSEDKEDIKHGSGDFVKTKTEEEVNAFLTQLTKNDKWGSLKNGERQNLILKLAAELEKSEDCFVTLEKRRGISPTYVTTKALPFLVTSLRYYANFCLLTETTKKKDILLAKVSEYNCLSLLGIILGSSLAAGHRILFVTSNEFSPIIKFIELTTTKLGFPDGTISVLLNDVDLDSLIKYTSIISVFDENIDLLNKKIISIIPNTTPFIVFDNADLDSACESVINATWKNSLIFNCTAKEVFVQENVYKQFVKKLKEKVSTNNTFNTNSDKIKNELKDVISNAELNGIEVFPSNTDNIGKILLIGGRMNDKKYRTVPFVSVSAFRNIDEGVALTNNNIQGLSASVWTENIGLANYVAQKLDVSNVWINSFGIYSPDVAFSPRKYSGKGYFGGIQGFNEILHNTPASEVQGKSTAKGCEKLFSNAVNSAKNAQQNWRNLTRHVRISKFQKVIDCIDTIRNDVKSKTITEDWLNDWKLVYNHFIGNYFNCSVPSPINGYNLNVNYEPKGVLVMETKNIVESHNKRLLIASILEGNTLVLLNECQDLQNFYNDLSKELPNGVLNVVPYFDAAIVTATKNPLVDFYFNEYIIDEELGASNKFTTVTDLWPDVHDKVTNVKNVWSNIGQK